MAEETILSKITKLLALATSDNENESAMAAAKAQAMLLEHNVSEEELNEFNSVKDEKVIEVQTRGKTNSRVKWRVNLATVVASSNLCKLIVSTGSSLIWIGKKTNVEVAQYIFDTVTADLERIAEQEWQDMLTALEYSRMVNSHTKTPNGKTWKNSFYHGAVATIQDRLSTNLLALKEVPQTNALVVNNDEELKEYTSVHYPSLSRISTELSRYNRSGYGAGQAAGRTVRFGQGLGAGGSLGPRLLNSGD